MLLLTVVCSKWRRKASMRVGTLLYTSAQSPLMWMGTPNLDSKGFVSKHKHDAGLRHSSSGAPCDKELCKQAWTRVVLYNACQT